ncbi:DNA mismatch repair protein [Sarracenia purpurea var. burkii]
MYAPIALLDIVRHCTYIGMADDVFALLQHNTHLYLANVVNLSKELMYQQVLRRFAHFNAIQLSDPAPLFELIMLALKEEDLDPECNEKDEMNEKIAELCWIKPLEMLTIEESSIGNSESTCSEERSRTGVENHVGPLVVESTCFDKMGKYRALSKK